MRAGIEPPPRTLPCQQVHERVLHRGRRRDGVVRAHQRDADRARVVVQRVPAAHVGALVFAGVHRARRIILGPAAFVDASYGIDQPVVRDVDVFARDFTRADAAAQPRVVGDAVRRSRVVHDDLLNRGVVDLAALADAFVRTPLRAASRLRAPASSDSARAQVARRRDRRHRTGEDAKGRARPPPRHRHRRRVEAPLAG